MNRYWGDLHNHCGITYGYGSLKHALDRAKSHLDFCAVTGHAMWPDIPERNEETAFVVDFHRRGFQKLYDHWEEVRHTIAEANTEDFITFQAYEMHSSLYGDHHIVTPDDSLPLIYRDSPAQLLHDSGCDGITIAHHIGYTPGYRGINWDLYNPAVTPLIEVCSKHGCGMSETAPYPYYHNMGPREPLHRIRRFEKRISFWFCRFYRSSRRLSRILWRWKIGCSGRIKDQICNLGWTEKQKNLCSNR